MTSKFGAALLVATNLLLAMPSTAQWHAPDVQDPSSQADIQNALSGGVPMGRWKEGLMFEGIEPHADNNPWRGNGPG